MFSCKYCESVLQGSLVPGETLRCGECGKKNRLPQRREFAEISFDSLVLGPCRTELDRDTLAAAIASSRLAGARWNRIRGSLEKAGHTTVDLDETIDIARGVIRAQSRASGRGMFITGLVCTLIFVIATAVQFYLGWKTIHISASLLAIGVVYTLVGAVKWSTGINIQ